MHGCLGTLRPALRRGPIVTVLALAVAAPAAGAATPTPSKFVALPSATTMTVPRYGPAAAPTQGKVLIAGGATNVGFGAGAATKLLDLFDPTSGNFAALTGTLSITRCPAAGSSSAAASARAAGPSPPPRSTTRPPARHNVGAQPLRVDGFAVGGGQADDFAVGASSCVGVAVPFQGTCTFTVRFNPSATGQRVGTVRLADNEPVPLTIILTGNGVPPKTTTGTGTGTGTGTTTVITTSAPAGTKTRRFDLLRCRVRNGRARCTSRVRTGRVRVRSRSVKATLMRDGFVYGTGKALSSAGTRIELTPNRRLVRGRYKLLLTTGRGHHQKTRNRAVTIS